MNFPNKKNLIAGVTALALTLSTAAFAQRGEGKRDPQKRMEHRLTMMKDHLKLTADQEAKVRTIFEQNHAKMQALFEKHGRPERGQKPSQEAMAAMKQLRQETRDQLASVLTADQMTQWKSMQKDGRRGHRDSTPKN